jgi:hypothetical protein
MPQRERSFTWPADPPRIIIRLSLLLSYLWACLKYRVNPWNYFAINHRQFNWQKKIFSKLEIDRHIPERYRLTQFYYHPDTLPGQYPVFLKPEWGQNSNGVARIPAEKAYKRFCTRAFKSPMPYIVQEAGRGAFEYEIYYLRDHKQPDQAAFLSVTQTMNPCDPVHPVNSIYNQCTAYKNISQTLSAEQAEGIWSHVKKSGRFPLARMGVKADSVEDLAAGHFKVIEINLFLPMPLVLFSCNTGLLEKYRIIRQTMDIAARLAKQVPKNRSGFKIFFQKMLHI